MCISSKETIKSFNVCIDIESLNNTLHEKKYYIYKEINNTKYWLTKDLTLHYLKGYRAYIRSWNKAVILVSKILKRNIK